MHKARISLFGNCWNLSKKRRKNRGGALRALSGLMPVFESLSTGKANLLYLVNITKTILTTKNHPGPN
jgi:hypothetical protein